MYRRDPAGMAGTPGLKQVERLPPRTSPMMIRSGRSLSVERTRSLKLATPGRVRSVTQSGAAQLSSRVSSIRITRSSSRASSARSALASVVLPELVPPAMGMLRRLSTARRSASACSG